MRAMIELSTKNYYRIYDVSYSVDTLIPENKKYVDDVVAWYQCKKGYHEVKSKRILDRVHEKLEKEVL